MAHSPPADPALCGEGFVRGDAHSAHERQSGEGFVRRDSHFAHERRRDEGTAAGKGREGKDAEKGCEERTERKRAGKESRLYVKYKAMPFGRRSEKVTLAREKPKAKVSRRSRP